MALSQSVTDWSPYIPAAITASAAFVGAMLAQLVAHRYASAREQVKARSTAYELLFAPVATDVMALLDAICCPHGDSINPAYDGENRSAVLTRVLAHIFSHISHARAGLLRTALKQAQKRGYASGRGPSPSDQIHDFLLLHAFMVEYHDTLLAACRPSDVERIYWYRFRYRLLAVLLTIPGLEWEARTIIQHAFVLDGRVTPGFVRKFERKTERVLTVSDRGASPDVWEYLRSTVFGLESSYANLADKVWASRTAVATSS